MLNNPINKKSTEGAALVISLIILSVITLLGLSAMRSTRMETKISVNHQFKQTSFLAAESALAKLTGPIPEAQIPKAIEGSEPVLNKAYFSSTDVDGQADITADLSISYIKTSTPGEFKFSGYGLGVTSLIYQADAVGKVGSTHINTHNRMGLAKVRN